MERPVAEGATLHFVDDRYETLHAVVEQSPDLLQRWVPNPAQIRVLGWTAWVHALRCGTGAGVPCSRRHRRRQVGLCISCCCCRWKLYLADWGYNTAEERAAAARLPGVRLLSRPQFLELLRWGVVMEASVVRG